MSWLPPSRTEAKRRVYLVEGHPVTRQGFRLLIDREADLMVCGLAATAREALAEIGAAKPDIAVIDIALPGRDGIELIKDLVVQHPRVAMLVLSNLDESIYANRALQAGAMGYVNKYEPVEHILMAVRDVLEGEIYLSTAMRNQLLLKSINFSGNNPTLGVDLLSDRELQIFRMLGEGMGTRQLAKTLNLSISTVETHRTHIKDKLGVKSATELLRQAVIWLNNQNFEH